MWSKYVTRRLAVQVAQAWNFGWGTEMQKVYGVSVRNTLVFRDSQKTEYYVDDRQHKKYVSDLYRLLRNKKFIKTFHPAAQTVLERILADTKRRLRGNIAALDNAELLALYRNFILPNQTQFYIRMWTVFNIGEPLADTVRGCLAKYVQQEQEITQYLLELSSPLVPNDVLNERKDLLRLAIEKDRLGKERFAAKMRRHASRYCHIPMFDFDHEPYTLAHFQHELNGIANPSAELADIQKLFRGRQKRFTDILMLLKPDNDTRDLLEFLKENVFLRDYRDMIRQKLNLELRKFYAEVGNRLGLTLSQVATLTNDEIVQYLKSGKPFPKTEIARREISYLLIQKDRQVSIYSGRRALEKAKQELRQDTLGKRQEIKGVIGSGGIARGPVKVVFTNKDLYKVKTGDVLVATMTRQDFVSVMRHVAAVVTDEGSVTAHAAIITREIGIPCIVATKIGTKILKDGDWVEVDANKGVVKILKRK